MLSKLVFCLYLFGLTGTGGSEFGCYWNNSCAYQLYGSKTPYDTVRGDLRDLGKPQGCQAVSLWSIHRHGNRNPGDGVTDAIKVVADLKDQIVAAYDEGRSMLCAQDVDEFRKWTWNATLEVSQSFLTGVGYEELYDMASRVRIAYPELLTGSEDDYYFRPTKEQRTITSAMAFVHGLSDGTNLTLNIDSVREVEDVVRTYQNCDRYQKVVKNGPSVTSEVADYENSAGYNAIKSAVQRRLGISYQITTEDLYAFYEICRFYRSWEEKKQSPWCAVFTDEDLVFLDYRDDVRHYHRNGYGSWVNVRLGQPPIKDLYESLQAAAQGQGKRVVSYFTHDTMMEMVYCALGLYKDSQALKGAHIDENRLWRTSAMGSMAINLMAVLNSCEETGSQTYRVQIFIGEKVTDLCPLEGCTWEEFQERFEPFADANLDFCSLDYPEPAEPDSAELDSAESDPATDGAVMHGFSWLILVQLSILLLRLF